MPQLRDFLDRFRPAGAPGAAALAGVPADRGAELADELSPVLGLLDETYRECARIVARAEDEAARITAAARGQAATVAADAADQARRARQEAADATLAAGRAERDRELAQAGQRATRTRELARYRVPELADVAVAMIRQLGTP
jgi:cell division septum initiation protein DivIVA